jgi:hypothetical protein
MMTGSGLESIYKIQFINSQSPVANGDEIESVCFVPSSFFLQWRRAAHHQPYFHV